VIDWKQIVPHIKVNYLKSMPEPTAAEEIQELKYKMTVLRDLREAVEVLRGTKTAGPIKVASATMAILEAAPMLIALAEEALEGRLDSGLLMTCQESDDEECFRPEGHEGPCGDVQHGDWEIG